MTPTEDPEVLCNFQKFLIGRDGKVVGRFAPTVAPDDPALISAIEQALAGRSATALACDARLHRVVRVAATPCLPGAPIGRSPPP